MQLPTQISSILLNCLMVLTDMWPAVLYIMLLFVLTVKKAWLFFVKKSFHGE